MRFDESKVTLKTETCRALLHAWLGWRGERLLPTHSDISPIDLKPILPMIGILEVRARDNAVYRLAGSGLRDVFGFDPTGQNAIDLALESFRVRRAYRVFMPATHPCGYHGESEFTYSSNVADWFESIGLPLAPNGPGGAPMVIFTMESLIGRQWRRDGGTIVDNARNILEFIDIGAGIPPSVDAPAGFLG